MLRSDAQTQNDNNNIFRNINNLRVDIILEIQKDIDPYDMVSLVFLLYDTPDTALQRLIVYQRLSNDEACHSINLLYDWALHAQSSQTWKYEFLEALTICRLYNIIRKLGFDVSQVKKHYLPDNLNVSIYIDPMKKVLYKLCESLNSEIFSKLQKTLISYNYNVAEYKTCELILLELISKRFIKLGYYDKEKKSYTNTYDIEELAKIIEKFSKVNILASVLREIQEQINSPDLKNKPQNFTSIEKYNIPGPSKIKEDKYQEGFDEIFELMNQCHNDEDEPGINLKSDITLLKDAYAIKNRKRIGVCCIINQDKFYPSKQSLQDHEHIELEDRLGSKLDVMALERTMTSLNFIVKSKSNLDHEEVFQFIKDVLKYHVTAGDSVFMLCILSHGVRGHVYAADSVRIKVDDIQNLLDSEHAHHLRGIPKVLILQACQVKADSEVKNKIVADGPSSNDFYLKKAHFLVYWATAPEYEAFRIEDKGSIFIQCICALIKKRAKYEHLLDIFTKVNNNVTALCTKIKSFQVPLYKTTLTKKLYLSIPE
ncbi:unnamed protein product [Danaus chrysippus]|uniref:(African queen) hypothetical protein n=1 Tax=Danaus chrysippus TaxID=151541 RepID=A0A8J2VXE2_9NEOP|nr:unnamed protein product [Danaus chrysippus]